MTCDRGVCFRLTGEPIKLSRIKIIIVPSFNTAPWTNTVSDYQSRGSRQVVSCDSISMPRGAYTHLHTHIVNTNTCTCVVTLIAATENWTVYLTKWYQMLWLLQNGAGMGLKIEIKIAIGIQADQMEDQRRVIKFVLNSRADMRQWSTIY